MINFSFLQYEDLTRDEIEDLWNQNVDLDDWDYMLVTDDLTQFKLNEDKEEYDESEYIPIEWCVSKLLTGCCRNVWYRVKFREKMQMMGVAYHS